MKFIIMVFASLLFSVTIAMVNSESTYAEEIDYFTVEKDFSEQTSTPLKYFWYRTGPSYDYGPYRYMSLNIRGQCMEGTLARIQNFTTINYAGYLYPCGSTVPIPTKLEVNNDV